MSVTKVSNPVISGTAKVGQVLTTSDGVWTTTSDYLTYEYQWMRVNAAGQSPIDIAGATSKNYTVQTSDLGYRLKVRVTPKEHDNAPDPEPPPGGATGTKLRWAPPALSNPTTKTISNSSRAIGNGNGGDVKVVTADRLLGGVGEIKSWNDLVAIAGEMFSNEANEGHIIPRENTGVFHLEGWRIVLSNAADAITCRWRQPTLQIQNCYIEVTTAGTSHHSDGFQRRKRSLTSFASIDARLRRTTRVSSCRTSHRMQARNARVSRTKSLAAFCSFRVFVVLPLLTGSRHSRRGPTLILSGLLRCMTCGCLLLMLVTRCIHSRASLHGLAVRRSTVASLRQRCILATVRRMASFASASLAIRCLRDHSQDKPLVTVRSVAMVAFGCTTHLAKFRPTLGVMQALDVATSVRGTSRWDGVVKRAHTSKSILILLCVLVVETGLILMVMLSWIGISVI